MYEAESENVCMSRCAEFIQVVWRAFLRGPGGPFSQNGMRHLQPLEVLL